MNQDTKQKMRLDKWLWQARFFKTRTLCAKIISGGHIRVNSIKISKPATNISIGDVLTFPQEDQVRVIEVVLFGTRRGPATEAQTLYLDLSPKQEVDLSKPQSAKQRRPTKKERRSLDLIRNSGLE